MGGKVKLDGAARARVSPYFALRHHAPPGVRRNRLVDEMSRYQALRQLGLDPLSAGFVALLNWMRGYPANRIVFLTVEIEVQPPRKE